jgi:hypothetical protein
MRSKMVSPELPNQFLCALYDWLCAVRFFELAISDPFGCCSCESQDERKGFRGAMKGDGRKMDERLKRRACADVVQHLPAALRRVHPLLEEEDLW